VTTRFRIGSITKAFTAVLVMQLVEEGRVRLDGTVSHYLPDYRGAGGERITVRHLLAHTAGLRDLSDFPRNSNDFPPIVAKINAGYTDTGELVRLIGSYDPLFAPGTAFRYSNDGYVLLGAIVERVTGKSYEQVLEERILQVAGMTNTGMAYATAVVAGRATGYDRTFAGYLNAAPMLVAANGGLYSSVDDLFRFSRAIATDKLISPASKAIMFEPTPNVTQFGWKVRPTAEAMLIADGSVPGFTALMIATDAGRRVVILLTNTREITHRVGDIYDAVMAALKGDTVAPPRQSIAEALGEALVRTRIDSGLVQAKQRVQSPRWYMNEAEFNSLGYFLLARRRIAEAIRVFSWNVEHYPTSANAYDSLGEAYAAAGDTSAAVRSYRRSLELNPQNANAKAVLEKLRP
jgi:CubicO group peptidase (beta-lactamase class C family)